MNEFKFNASEYAKMLGISTSAIRKRRLSGKLDGQFEKRNSEYFYKTPPKDRPNKGAVTPYNFKQFTSGDRSSMYRPKKYPSYYSRSTNRSRNVPYDETKYGNAPNGHQLQLTNDMRQKMRIDQKLKASDLEWLTDDLVLEVKRRQARARADKIKQWNEETRKMNAMNSGLERLKYDPPMTGRWYNHSTGKMEDYDPPKKDYSKMYYG